MNGRQRDGRFRPVRPVGERRGEERRAPVDRGGSLDAKGPGVDPVDDAEQRDVVVPLESGERVVGRPTAGGRPTSKLEVDLQAERRHRR